MDDKDFKIKTLEFHIENNSNKYNKCITQSVRDFINTNKDFNSTNCESLKKIVHEIFEEYKSFNN